MTVFFLIAEIPLGVIQATGDEIGGITFWSLFLLTQAAGLAIVAGYFAFFISTGHTLGMRAADIHVVVAGTGRSPALVRAASRGVLAVVFFLAIVHRLHIRARQLRHAALHLPPGIARRLDRGRLDRVLRPPWQVPDPAGRGLWDRLFGLAVIEDMVPSSMPERLWTPWGT